MNKIKTFYLIIGVALLFYVFSETDLKLLWSNLVVTGYGIFFVLAIYGIAFWVCLLYTSDAADD